MAVPAPWYVAFIKAWRIGCYVAAHLFVAVLLIGTIYAIQYCILLIGDPKLFDIIPLRFIFDGMDLGILAAFLIFGTYEAILVFGASE